MSYRFSWPKDQIAQANVEGKALFAAAYSGPGGRFEFYGPCDDRQATLVMMVANYMHTGMTLDEAVAAAKERAAKFDEKHPAAEANP